MSLPVARIITGAGTGGVNCSLIFYKAQAAILIDKTIGDARN